MTNNTSTIRIVTDSTCDLPSDIVEALGITVVPLTVLFGEEELRDGVDITAEQFFRRLGREKVLPTTAAPGPGVFRTVYERLVAEGATHIVSIHVSSKLSATLESARQGGTGLPVTHVDSLQVSLALGVPVMEAARALQQGATVEQIVAVALDTARRTQIFFTLETLEYLRRGGRMSRGQEFFGSLLQIKPVITVQDGEVHPAARMRTKAKAVEELLRRCSDMRPVATVFALHASTPEELAHLRDRLHGLAPESKYVESRITPVIGVHVGPGAVSAGVTRAPDVQSPSFLPA